MFVLKRFIGNTLKNRSYLKYRKSLVTYYVHRKYSDSPYDINININGVSLNKFISNLREEYEELKNSGPNKRLAEIKHIIDILDKRKKLVHDISQLNDLLSEEDKDLKQLAVEERKSIEGQIAAVDKELENAILRGVGGTDDCHSIVVEVNSGVGGQEAMLFAKELFDMYCGFVNYKGWRYEVADYATTDLGGIRHATAFVDGENCLRFFRYEAGVHRVQRIPLTEKAGRVHTSTVAVVVTPQPTDIEIDLQSNDLIVETKRASGAGGQHVNTTDSAVRVTHVPTGISVECQVDRSQIKNRSLALQKLRAKLYQLELEKQQNEIAATKKSQVKSNFRNEKIRTYNFSQDRITDHRLQSSNAHNLKHFMQGNELLENLINKLYIRDKVEQLSLVDKK